MSKLQLLAKDTAIYGLSSIIGRFLNYFLTPLYTITLSAASGAYGVITNIYAYTALITVLLTFGMETTYFRFTNKTQEDPTRVYSTTLISVGTVALAFIVTVLLLLNPLSRFMGYADHPEYVGVMAVTVAVDAFLCIPFSHLRQQNRALRFASLKLVNIMMSIVLNIVYFVWLGGKDVGYVFYINLVCTLMLALLMCKELTGFSYVLDKALLRRMLKYAWPILILGIAGILNQAADKMLFPYIYKGADAQEQLGIYGAAFKVAMIMGMITQAFRYAYEPIVFASAKDKGQNEMYAKAMKYFVIFTLLAYLMVMAYLDVLKFVIGSDYWSGLSVVPIVMAAEIMMGVYFNLSFWYKLIDKTIWGAVFSGIGCAVLLAVNFIFVPRYGYMACAWGGFAGYGVAMVLSYVVGQKYYPINYPMQSILYYVLLTAVSCLAMNYVHDRSGMMLSLVFNTLVVVFFISVMVHNDFPLSNLPFVGKYFRK